jgi:hypothetical protein
MGLGKIRGCDVQLQLYTVPGQQKYASTRKMVLKGVDGIVFVADSLEVRRKANLLSLKDLQGNLKEMNLSIFKVPVVLHYNKRDLADEGFPIMPIETMDKEINSKLKAPSFQGSAVQGTGCWDALKECIKLTMINLNKELSWAE